MRRDVRRPDDPIRQRAEQRERALKKLSQLTTGAAVAGTFATVGFGGLAAITYSGTSANAAVVDDGTSQNQQSTTAPGAVTNPYVTNPYVSNPGATQPPTQQFAPAPVQPPTISRHRSHVSSGSS